ncbi:unnamed protein product [Rhodiola kirilowii]
MEMKCLQCKVAEVDIQYQLIMGRQSHVLMVPFPAQGHISPLMKLANVIADHGVKVTFVNTEIMHTSIMAARANSKVHSQVTLVSVTDGLEPGDNGRDAIKFMRSLLKVLPGQLGNLIEKPNGLDEKLSYAVVDTTLGWLVEDIKKMGMKCAAFSPAGPSALAAAYHIPKLIEDGIVDLNGTAQKGHESVSLSDGGPAFNTNEFPWTFPFDPETQKVIFEYASSTVKAIDHSDHVLCNAFQHLDSPTCGLIPNLLCIGPLLNTSQSGSSGGSIWQEDSTCLTWLDTQPTNSVIYVAFGSMAIFSQNQFDEIAIGLELTGRPFLWVVRPDLMNGAKVTYPDGFLERTSKRGKIVEWAPQDLVLAHGSISLFISHCGWNSTIEALTLGIPFLCWPYFSDQFQNKRYICDVWRVGLALDMDKNRIVSSMMVKGKVESLLSDLGITANALKFKERAMASASPGGSSFGNLKSFIKKLKNENHVLSM